MSEPFFSSSRPTVAEIQFYQKIDTGTAIFLGMLVNFFRTAFLQNTCDASAISLSYCL